MMEDQKHFNAIFPPSVSLSSVNLLKKKILVPSAHRPVCPSV